MWSTKRAVLGTRHDCNTSLQVHEAQDSAETVQSEAPVIICAGIIIWSGYI